LYAPDVEGGGGRDGDDNCRGAFFLELMRQPLPDLALLTLREVAFPSSWRFAQFLGHSAQSDTFTELRFGGLNVMQRATLEGLSYAQHDMPPNADMVAAQQLPFKSL
jgi:hypothetical protein